MQFLKCFIAIVSFWLFFVQMGDVTAQQDSSKQVSSEVQQQTEINKKTQSVPTEKKVGTDNDSQESPWWQSIWTFLTVLLLAIITTQAKKIAEYLNPLISLISKKQQEQKAEASEVGKDNYKRRKLLSGQEQYFKTLKGALGRLGLYTSTIDSGQGDEEKLSSHFDFHRVYVPLNISRNWKVEGRLVDDEKKYANIDNYDITPIGALQQLQKHNRRLLIIVGDPGAGKTTMMRYYALNAMGDLSNGEQFEDTFFPMYLPLRELKGESIKEISLAEALVSWRECRESKTTKEHFEQWLQEVDTQYLVLLDGLDELDTKEERQAVSCWINKLVSFYNSNVLFVVTTRPNGFFNLQEYYDEDRCIRADMCDLNDKQQKRFVEQWLTAGYSYKTNMSEKDRINKVQSELTNIWQHLTSESGLTLKQLLVNPLLLQIFILVFEKEGKAITTRLSLYKFMVDHVLDARDKQKGISGIFKNADEVLKVLAYVAYQMHTKFGKDEILIDDMYGEIAACLKKKQETMTAKDCCMRMEQRTGLIMKYGDNRYIFKHKSFREYLTAVGIHEYFYDYNCNLLAENLWNGWWAECLRFIFEMCDAAKFNFLMGRVFAEGRCKDLTVKQQEWLHTLIRDCDKHGVDALALALKSKKSGNPKKRFILDCLQTIANEEAYEVIEGFIRSSEITDDVQQHALEILRLDCIDRWNNLLKDNPQWQMELGFSLTLDSGSNKIPKRFYHTIENYGEYIFIERDDEKDNIDSFYLAKYPVTNKQFQTFIDYLNADQEELLKLLPLAVFEKAVKAFLKAVKSHDDKKFSKHVKLPIEVTRYTHKDFNGDHQPVVGVTWYGARLYCYWLSCLHYHKMLENSEINLELLVSLYRLPTEEEWQWAAAKSSVSEELREFPWNDKEHDSEKANYGGNIGRTTQVGRYPKGVSCDSLMDMAGNVWEWQENWYDDNRRGRALRGGSWFNPAGLLRCSARDDW